MNLPKNPFLLPGIAIRTSSTDHFPLEQMLLQRWSNGNWRSFGGIWSQRASLEQSVSPPRRVTRPGCLPSGRHPCLCRSPRAATSRAPRTASLAALRML